MVDPRRFKDEIFAQFARVAGAMSSPKRLELLDVLAQGEASVESLAIRARLPLKNASAHLRVLRGAKLVDTRRDGARIYYRLASPSVYHLYTELLTVGRERLAEVDRLVRDFLAGRDDLEPVDRGELERRMAAGDVTVLDVRPVEEYHAGHIRGAVSVPLGELSERLAQLPKDRDVVAYCRGQYCVLAVEAVAMLRREGFRARRLADGFPDWQAERLPVETA